MFISQCSKKATKQPASYSQLQSAKYNRGPYNDERNCLNSFEKHLNISHNLKSNEKSKKGKKVQKSLVTDSNEKEQHLSLAPQTETAPQMRINSVFRPIQPEKNQMKIRYSEKMATNPKLGKWSLREQSQCFNFFLEHLADWKLISEKLRNRNLNSIKNLFYSSIRSIKKSFSGTFFKKLVNSSCKSLVFFVS